MGFWDEDRSGGDAICKSLISGDKGDITLSMNRGEDGGEKAISSGRILVTVLTAVCMDWMDGNGERVFIDSGSSLEVSTGDITGSEGATEAGCDIVDMWLDDVTETTELTDPGDVKVAAGKELTDADCVNTIDVETPEATCCITELSGDNTPLDDNTDGGLEIIDPVGDKTEWFDSTEPGDLSPTPLMMESAYGLNLSINCGFGPETGKFLLFNSALSSATFISSRFENCLIGVRFVTATVFFSCGLKTGVICGFNCG